MKKSVVTIVIAALILIVAGIVVIDVIKEKNAPGTETLALTDYYAVADGEAMIIMDDKVYGKSGVWYEGHPYIDHASVTELFNHRFFWSAEENLVVLTTPSEVIQITPNDNTVIINDEPVALDFAPATLKGTDLYISIEYLSNYADLTYRIYNEPNRVLIGSQWDEYLFAVLSEDTQIRNDSNVKALIVEELKAGDKVMYIDGGGIQQNGFVKVMSEDGVRGYINTEFLEDSFYEAVKGDYTAPEYTQTSLGKPVFLGWELIYTKDNVGYLSQDLAHSPEVNVVSPTWFFLSDTEGSMQSYANDAYVSKAHEKGVQVWALYKNDSIDGKFECTEGTHKVLSSFAARHTLINNMLDYAHQYNIDGINIDFEALKTETGIYFVEFLRELSVRCRAESIILSVDNYVPAGYNAFYDLEEQGQVVDYIILMGYDEHYSGSEEAGSVSSLPWFGAAIDNTLELVSPERVVMAVPFYTRLWKETSDGGLVSSTHDMNETGSVLSSYGISVEWDEDTCQYYGEKEINGAKYRIWVEDKESLAKKVELIGANNLAGVAGWKLSDEADGTYKMIVQVYTDSIQ